ncbi:hypothetical protein C8R46DRAFT_881011 [Mycena filopes]|nr:hypothetical protein C8R46DRAFT_881011 [Mycena filopes]
MPPHTRRGGNLRLLASGPVNTIGLPVLPVELLHEIVSHLPGAPVPCLSWHVLSKDHLARSQGLRALSETCQRLRRVFLAQAWQHVEVCASPKISSLYKFKARTWPVGERRFLWSEDLAMDLARELARQTEILTIRNPAFAAQVRTFSVALSESSADTLFPEFFQCLALLRNLETLQIIFAPPGTYYLHLALDRNILSFQSIRTLVLHENAHEILKCCPNVERLYLHRLGFFDHLGKHLPKLRLLSSPPIYAQNIAGECCIIHLTTPTCPFIIILRPRTR